MIFSQNLSPCSRTNAAGISCNTSSYTSGSVIKQARDYFCISPNLALEFFHRIRHNYKRQIDSIAWRESWWFSWTNILAESYRVYKSHHVYRRICWWSRWWIASSFDCISAILWAFSSPLTILPDTANSTCFTSTQEGAAKKKFAWNLFFLALCFLALIFYSAVWPLTGDY